ncbi:Cmc1 protein [Martiniozyma asiatica (nom. inval.)]|nr:Cmc1 protein [Martiniozyma asiatica]
MEKPQLSGATVERKLDRELKLQQVNRINGLPAWMLTPKEEKEVLEQYQVEVWKRCDQYAKAFKQCEEMHGMTVFFKCKEESRILKQCIDDQHRHEFVDEVRDAYIQKKIELAKQAK